MEKFTFGKYKGYSVDEVISSNPKYVLWARKNVSYFSLTNEQESALLSMLERMIPDWPCSTMDDEWCEEMSWCEGMGLYD